MTSTEQDDIDEVARAVDEYVQADIAEKYYADLKQKLGAFISSSLKVGEERRVDGKGVKLVAGQRRFSAKKAGAVLPEQLFDMVAVRAADAGLAKHYLPEEWYEKCRETVSDPYLRRVG